MQDPKIEIVTLYQKSKNTFSEEINDFLKTEGLPNTLGFDFSCLKKEKIRLFSQIVNMKYYCGFETDDLSIVGTSEVYGYNLIPNVDDTAYVVVYKNQEVLILQPYFNDFFYLNRDVYSLKKCIEIVLSTEAISGEGLSSKEVIQEIAAIDDLALYSQKLAGEKNCFWPEAIRYHVTYYE
jgi:hypothetical protein